MTSLKRNRPTIETTTNPKETATTQNSSHVTLYKTPATYTPNSSLNQTTTLPWIFPRTTSLQNAIMATPLVTTHHLQSLTPSPTSLVRVKNLSTTIRGPHDAWARPGRPQPVLVSAEVSFTGAFGLSSEKDSVAGDTVHYGLLSKEILVVLEKIGARAAQGGGAASLDEIMGYIWEHLTGRSHTGVCSAPEPFLSMKAVRQLTVSIMLPKASLLGNGVSLTASAVFESSAVKARSLALDLVELRVPTLVGVNPNEREAKQVVVANVGIERYADAKDEWVGLEKAVVQVSQGE